MTQAAAGRIINISCARCGFPGLAVYCSSKTAVERITHCWAAELDRNESTVNFVNPGPIQTALVENIPKDIVEQQKANTPIEKRLGTVDDVAKIVA
jgi:3-oxoacyl-[acyl-carrier protein] reductase